MNPILFPSYDNPMLNSFTHFNNQNYSKNDITKSEKKSNEDDRICIIFRFTGVEKKDPVVIYTSVKKKVNELIQEFLKKADIDINYYTFTYNAKSLNYNLNL